MKFDKKQTRKGGRPLFFVPGGKMADKFNERYSSVLAGMNDENAEYILRCISEPKLEIKNISVYLNGFYRAVFEASQLVNKAEELFGQRCEKICTLVKKYNDTINTDGIWNTVEPAESKKKLNTFYSFLVAVERLNEEEISVIEPDILTESDVEVSKRISLLKRAAFLFEGKNKIEADSIFSKYKICHSMSEEIIRKNAVLFERIQHNEAVLGKYISSLAIALDEKNKGDKMNLSLARNCAEVFLANYITEK